MIRERIISFGPDRLLFGIVSMDMEAPRRQPVLIPNAGIVHRIGPHRLHVRLARALAARGHPVLRFDLHGLGDSGPPAPHLGFEEQAVEDIGCAIDVLKTQSVAVIGLCSGADNAMRAGLVDERIGRLILLDPHAYGSARASAMRFVEKAASPDRWMRAASRLLGGGGVDAVPRQVDGEELEEADRLPIERSEFARQLQVVTSRGGQVFIRYTNFVRETLTTPSHFYNAFPETDFGAGLLVEVDRETDHTYTALAAQRRLIAKIGDWMAAAGGDGEDSA